MAINKDDLDAFHQFAVGKIQNGGVDSFYELAELWTIEHPSSEQLVDDIAAARAAVLDMRNGDRGRPAGELIEELRQTIDSSNE